MRLVFISLHSFFAYRYFAISFGLCYYFQFNNHHKRGVTPPAEVVFLCALYLSRYIPFSHIAILRFPLDSIFCVGLIELMGKREGVCKKIIE